MCVGNKAPQATLWVNRQVQALWELAQKCVECTDKEGLGIKPPTTEILLGTALAQLCVGRHPNLSKKSKNDLDFYASFDAPELDFVCNHEVIIKFKLRSGQFRATNMSKQVTLESFKSYHCAFRVPFKQHVIVDRNVDNAVASKATFLVFDLKRATFVHESSGFQHDKLDYNEADRKRRAIIHNLTTEYLPLLTRAGFHFIQSLPDFDSLSSVHRIDWSALAQIELETHVVCGINVSTINTFLKGRWLEAAWRCSEIKGGYSHGGFSALAEHEVTIDVHTFHVFFAPPQIRALCSREVVLYLDIPHIDVNLGTGPAPFKWSNWRIAIVVDVVLVEEEGGLVQRLKLDFTNARHCHNLSFFGSDSFTEIRTLLIEYICTQYLTILTECYAHFVYYVDLRLTGQEETLGEGVLQKDPKDHLFVTNTFGFDFVTSLTQGSVNKHLAYLWRKIDILKRSFSDNLECEFGAPRIQLPSDSRSDTVILSLALNGGWLKLEALGKEEYRFRDWSIAFEVKLDFEQCTEKYLWDSVCGSDTYHVKHQLVLDVKNAKFRPDLSSFPGLLDDPDFHLMRLKYIHIVHYMRDNYLPQWTRAEEKPHVLYILPSHESRHSWSQDKFSITSPRFQLYHVPSNIPGESIHAVNRGVILICAMISNTLRPAFPLPPSSWTWRHIDDEFHGSIVLSRSCFLDRWRSNSLDHINACSTLIPALGGVAHSSDWRFKLVTLKQALSSKSEAFDWIKGRPYQWKETGSDASKINFRHHNYDTWSYSHVGSGGHDHDGTCSMACKTENTMEVPTTFDKEGCKIKIRGVITLEMTFCGEISEKQWTTKASAEWSSTITFTTGDSGQCLKVFVTTTPPTVQRGSAGFYGNYSDISATFNDAATLLGTEMEEMRKELMLATGELRDMEKIWQEHPQDHTKEILQDGLNGRFQGSWNLLYTPACPYTLRYPSFNSRGDLILGLKADYNKRPELRKPGPTNIMVSDAKVLTRKESASLKLSSAVPEFVPSGIPLTLGNGGATTKVSVTTANGSAPAPANVSVPTPPATANNLSGKPPAVPVTPGAVDKAPKPVKA